MTGQQILGLFMVGTVIGTIFWMTIKTHGVREGLLVWAAAFVLVGTFMVGLRMAIR